MSPQGSLDRYFRITERGSTLSREIRGGLATFFAMAYIIVLNPIILSSAKDMYGHQLDYGQLVTATAVAAAFTTLLMGVIGNVPIALAAGLGVNTVVALQLAPRMSWPDAMGMVVLAGFIVMLLVATGLRERVMNAVPLSLRKGISIGIGLFIMLIGLVDSGFVTRIPDIAKTTVPLQLGASGHLDGWPVLVFVLGALLTLALIVRKVPGAILISIVAMTLLAVVIEAIAKLPAGSWGLTTPKWPGNPVATPDRAARRGQSVRRLLEGRCADGCPLRLHGPAVVFLRRDGHDHGRRRRGQADRRGRSAAGHQQGAVRRRHRGRGRWCQLLVRHDLFRGVDGRCG